MALTKIKGTGIANLAVDTAQLAADAVTNAKIDDLAVDTEHIAASAVETAKINNDAVSLAKMAPGTDGAMLTYDASGNPVAITGSDGQVATSAGANAVSAFEDVSVTAGFIPTNGLKLRCEVSGMSSNDWFDSMPNDITGSVSGAQYRVGSRFEFDDTDDYIDFGNPTVLRITGAITMDMWVIIDSFPADGSYKVLGGQGQFGDSTNGRSTFTAIYGNHVHWHLATVTVGGVGVNSSALTEGVLYHISGVFTGINESNNVKIYVDGALDAQTTVSDDTKKSEAQGAKDWWLGKDPAGRFFGGKIKSFRVWNRALTAAEIAGCYNAGAIH